MKRELNDRFLRSLKSNPSGRLEISDTKCAGLRFRLSPSGHASWVYEKRIKGGAKRKFTLGTWPKPVSLANARAMAFEIQAEAARGFDRVEETRMRKKAEAAEEAKLVSCRFVLDAYRDLHLKNIKTGEERYRQITWALAEALDLPITELSRKDLQAAVDRKSKSGALPYANRIRSALTAFANWAFVRGYIEDPIGAGIAKAAKERARERVLNLAEVREIWKSSRQLGEVWGPFFRIMILTGQRRSEIAKLRWSEVDLENRTITKPGSMTKNGRPHTTHLSEPARHELLQLQSGERNSEYVFTFDGVRPVANPSHAKARLDKVLGSGFESWRIHDLRTAMATKLAEVGEPETVVDRILNHAASGSAPSAVSRIYNQSDLLPQRAAALDMWAQLVAEEAAQIYKIGQA